MKNRRRRRRRSSPGAFFPTLSGEGNPLRYIGATLKSPRRATAAICESQKVQGRRHCARALILLFSLSFCLGEFLGPALLLPNERVARRRRAPAAGLCARPGRQLGPDFLGLYCRSGRGGRPEIGPRGSVASPFFLQHAGARTDTAPPVPGTSYPIAGVWGARIWCSGHRTVCTALRPRALVRQDLQRPCIQLPAVGALLLLHS